MAPTPFDHAAAERGRRLMDAAPDLLAALEGLLKVAEEIECGPCSELTAARAAIAKAEGVA